MSDLARFVEAQAAVIDNVRAELAAGRKTTHWMWFIFPQVAGLGRSAMAERYAIRSLDEARAYLAHPVLGPRLRECTGLVLASGRPVKAVFGAPDDLKFRSCMTLFVAADHKAGIFRTALARFWNGAADAATLRILDL